MSVYGFYIHNDNGEVVLTDKYIIYQLFEESTLVGTYNSAFNCYEYINDSSTVQFFKLDVGDWLGRTHSNIIISNRSTIKTRKLKTADTIFRESGEYGLYLYNSSGVLTYSSNSAVGGIKESINYPNITFSTPLFTVSPPTTHTDREYEWFCITTTWIVSGIFNGVQGTGCPVVGRSSFSSISLGYVRMYTPNYLSIKGNTLTIDSNCRMTVLCA